jgi:hypothetical protein
MGIMEQLGGIVALAGIMVWGLLAVACLIQDWREKRAAPPVSPADPAQANPKQAV